MWFLRGVIWKEKNETMASFWSLVYDESQNYQGIFFLVNHPIFLKQTPISDPVLFLLTSDA